MPCYYLLRACRLLLLGLADRLGYNVVCSCLLLAVAAWVSPCLDLSCVYYVNFCCLRAWAAGITARLAAAVIIGCGPASLGRRARLPYQWEYFMNELLDSRCSLRDRLLPCSPARTGCL